MSGRRQGSIDGGGVEAASLHFTGRGPRLRRSPQLRLHSSVTAHGMGWLALLILGMEGGKKSDAAPAIAKKEGRRRGKQPSKTGHEDMGVSIGRADFCPSDLIEPRKDNAWTVLECALELLLRKSRITSQK
ncbi:hypothetical protein MY5147_008977 [Beauveria neobassiana]